MPTIGQYLKDHHITYVSHEHPAVFTCEEAEKHCVNVPGIPGKNLFLRSSKGKRYFLVILPASKRADLKQIAQTVGESKISFASAETLKEKLGLEPGSVSPFGLINDQNHEIEVYIDAEIYNAPLVNFHPNRNTASLELTREMFHKYLGTQANKVTVIK